MAGDASRREWMRRAAGGAAALAAPWPLRAAGAFRLGLTPVFLDNDPVIMERLRDAIEAAMGRPIELVQRRTYQDVTGLLLEGSIDAAWLCGYPFLQHRDRLALLAVPIWRGRPLYRSYLIVGQDDHAAGLDDLRGATHAFSDIDSNSGYLVTASDLARRGEAVEAFFGRTIFTYGHRNVVRAVAGGLVRSGSVDGYVWEALGALEPALAGRTRVVARSEWMGFPPFCALGGRAGEDGLRAALLDLPGTEAGRAALGLLQLDGLAAGEPALFDAIARRMRDLDGLR